MGPKPQAPKSNPFRSKGHPRKQESKTTEPPLRDGDTMFLFDQGPKINGSSLQYTSSTTKAFKIPEPRL